VESAANLGGVNGDLDLRKRNDFRSHVSLSPWPNIGLRRSPDGGSLRQGALSCSAGFLSNRAAHLYRESGVKAT